jgi:hypothetical protein
LVRDSRRQRQHKRTDDSSLDGDDDTDSVEESNSSDSNGSAGWSFGSFLYRTTLRLVGISNEQGKTTNDKSSKRDGFGNDEDSDADGSGQRRSAPPTDAELAAMRTRTSLSSPPAEVIQDIRQKAEEIQRNTPRGREVIYPQAQPPAEVVLAYDMAKAAVRSTSAARAPPANMYSLASVPPAERRHYIDVFDDRNNNNNGNQAGRLH